MTPKGVLLLTNDGDFMNAVVGPRSDVEKEYLVRVEGVLSRKQLKTLEKACSSGITAVALQNISPGSKHQKEFLIGGGHSPKKEIPSGEGDVCRLGHQSSAWRGSVSENSPRKVCRRGSQRLKPHEIKKLLWKRVWKNKNLSDV